MSNKETPLTKEEAIAAAAKLAGVSEELIYAITEQNRDQLPFPDCLREWEVQPKPPRVK